MEEIINEQLVRDLYSQYNPSADILQALKLSKNFEDNEEFVKAFYSKYAPEKLTLERLQNIKKKYYPTKEQKEWVAFLNEEGYFAKVVKGLDECIETAECYLKLP